MSSFAARLVLSIGTAALTLASGCAGGGGVDPESQGATASSVQDLTIALGRNAIGYDFADRANLPHGIAAGSALVFVTEPLNARVAVLDRFTGAEVGTLPAPAGGFQLPFAARVPRDGHVVILDPGGFPSPTTPSVARIYDYDYTYNLRTHTFTGHLTRSVLFTGLPVVFAEDVEVLDDGTELMSESIIGALWLVRPDGTIEFGLFPASPDPGDAIPQLAPCFLPDTTVGGVPYHSAGNFGPGIVALAAHAGQVYFSSTCQGGVFSVPVASLSDPTRTPSERAADIREVSPRPLGTVEAFEGLTFNRFDGDDDRIYVADSFRLALTRIDIHTGARETLLQDETLLNFPSALQFGSPVLGLTPLFVASDQEYRLPALNAGVTTDMTQPPYELAKVYVRGR